MKNVFMWVVKFILAVLVIIGVSYLLTGAEYLILSIFNFLIPDKDFNILSFTCCFLLPLKIVKNECKK